MKIKNNLIVALAVLTSISTIAFAQQEQAPAAEKKTQKATKFTSIYDYLYNSYWIYTKFTFYQDSKGNKIAFMPHKQEVYEEQYKQRVTNGDLKNICESTGGAYYLERELSGRGPADINTSQVASYATDMETRNFLKRYIPGAENALAFAGINTGEWNSSSASYVVRNPTYNKYAYIYDMTLRSGSVGTFLCVDKETNRPKWVFNHDLYNIHKGYTGAGGSYRSGYTYSAYFADTFIVYENENFTPGNNGLARLPSSSENISWPAKGYYVTIAKENGKWQTKNVSKYVGPAGLNSIILQKAPKRNSQNEEVLVVSEDGNMIIPAYQDKNVNFDSSRTGCHPDSLKFNQAWYSVCSSSFADAPQEHDLLTKGVALFFSKSNNALYYKNMERTVGFMQDRFQEALIQADVKKAISDYAPSARSSLQGPKKRYKQNTKRYQ